MNPAARHSTKRLRCSATRRGTSRWPDSAHVRGTQLQVSFCTREHDGTKTDPRASSFRGIRAI